MLSLIISLSSLDASESKSDSRVHIRYMMKISWVDVVSTKEWILVDHLHWNISRKIWFFFSTKFWFFFFPHTKLLFCWVLIPTIQRTILQQIYFYWLKCVVDSVNQSTDLSSRAKKVHVSIFSWKITFSKLKLDSKQNQTAKLTNKFTETRNAQLSIEVESPDKNRNKYHFCWLDFYEFSTILSILQNI